MPVDTQALTPQQTQMEITMRRTLVILGLVATALTVPAVAASAAPPAPQHELCLVTYGAGPQGASTADDPRDFCVNW